MINNKISVISDTSGKLTATQIERVYALSHIFREDASILVPLLKPRGENSYPKVYDKAIVVSKAKGVMGDYYTALVEEFERYDILSVETIVSIVSEVRAGLDLPPYVKRIKSSSLTDFFKLFLYKEVYEEREDGSVGDLIGYEKVFCLKANN
ncbi:hypothetical protein [Daejeonella sp. JGW-45]|uniref:hypothetical protein n=1 Tax=Daejeonella sp. JGW-45 TaxID=3034148 RepID=UPI0023EA8445|nr:hypothetical protein [Daejeonella sp. JGW-45]